MNPLMIVATLMATAESAAAPKITLIDDMIRSGQGKVRFGRSAPVDKAPDRVGRNSPCPCKSGRKYKRCCGR